MKDKGVLITVADPEVRSHVEIGPGFSPSVPALHPRPPVGPTNFKKDMLLRSLSSTLVLASLAACSNPFYGCTTDVRPAFIIAVEDAASGENLAPGAIVWVRDGIFVDTLENYGDSHVGPLERAGIYTLMAEHPGYERWQRTDVRVTANDCHVNTQQITARMVSQS